MDDYKELKGDGLVNEENSDAIIYVCKATI